MSDEKQEKQAQQAQVFTEAEVRAAASAAFKVGWKAACGVAFGEVRKIIEEGVKDGHPVDAIGMSADTALKMFAWVAEQVNKVDQDDEVAEQPSALVTP
jgi:hypothetical protein